MCLIDVHPGPDEEKRQIIVHLPKRKMEGKLV